MYGRALHVSKEKQLQISYRKRRRNERPAHALSPLRQCNAHYNNFQYENALAFRNDNSMATLFNSLKVHINKTTCARVLSVNSRRDTPLYNSQPCAHSKLIILPFQPLLDLPLCLHSFLCVSFTCESLIAYIRRRNGSDGEKKYLN